MGTKLDVSVEVAQRLRTFMSSEFFAVQSQIAKSEYWEHHADQLHANVGDDSVRVAGDSGFYVPQKASVLQRTARRIVRAIQRPSKAVYWVVEQLMSRVRTPRLMSYEKAFDAVMNHVDVSVCILSPYTTNHIKLAQHPKVFKSTESIKQSYQSWSGYKASANIILHYYYQNLLRGAVNEDEIGTVLEIGAGNGNFASIIFHEWAPVRMIIVDLPETLAISIPFLSSLFPKAKFVLPNEIQVSGLPKDFDFAFLTVDQLELLDDNAVDLAINCHSFQEMTHEQIDVYFRFVQRVCRESGFFFVSNRVEKIPCGPDAFTVEQRDPPNRFAEYPWNSRNETLFYEISRLSRLVSLDGVSIRLECVHKCNQ